nr:hypothetical protein [Tanacetum cinerariifolium]
VACFFSLNHSHMLGAIVVRCVCNPKLQQQITNKEHKALTLHDGLSVHVLNDSVIHYAVVCLFKEWLKDSQFSHLSCKFIYKHSKVMEGLPRCDELLRSANTYKWEEAMILYYRMSIIKDSTIDRETNRLCGEIVAMVEEREQFIQELDALPGRLVLEKMAEFLLET